MCVCVYRVRVSKKVLERNEVIDYRAIKFIPNSSKIRKKLMSSMLSYVQLKLERKKIAGQPGRLACRTKS